MTIIYLSIYVIIILLIWGLFAVVRMHAMKFKNFSTHITPITNLLMILLIILSIIGFIVIFSISGEDTGIDTITKSDKIEKVLNNKTPEKKEVPSEENYKEEIIDNYY